MSAERADDRPNDRPDDTPNDRLKDAPNGALNDRPHDTPTDTPLARRRGLLIGLVLVSLVMLVAGVVASPEGWSIAALAEPWSSADGWALVRDIRAPRSLGAWLTGALLGLAGAVAQGLFRNPLADPYLLGSASGASLGVVLVLAAGALGGHVISLQTASAIGGIGLVGAAFGGALAGVLLTLALARGARETTRLLLAGVVVGVVLAAVSDLVTSAAPEALRGKQAFMLGSTGFVGWRQCAVLGIGLVLTLPFSVAWSRALDALTLGDDTAQSLGLPLGRVRVGFVCAVALATGVAVSQTGLIAFVGLVAPHVVRRFASGAHRFVVFASALAGGTLLLSADVLARSLIAPQEVPVGVLTALLGGGYLVWLLRRRRGGA